MCLATDRFWPDGYGRGLLATTVYSRTSFLGREGVSHSVPTVPTNLAAML